MQQSVRSQVVARRTYNRPKNAEGTVFESWEETIGRVIGHQKWLWERVKGEPLVQDELNELLELGALMEGRKSLLSGRTLWLGGTDISKKRESSQFNCSFSRVTNVHDVVSGFWLLLQGCGVGFEPVTGTLNGFAKPLEVEIIRSTITRSEWDAGVRGETENYEFYHGKTWTIQIGDSAEAWCKAAGKLLAGKRRVDKLVIDLSQIRPAGIRLKGYGWISSGDETFAKALTNIAEILNRRADQLLSRIDILDIMNHLGTTLSSRRSAEIALVPFNDPEWEAFALAKKDYWTTGNTQRAQSNNSLVFYQKPSKLELRAIFDMLKEGGGSEPGFVNGEAAKKRAPWFAGLNPSLRAGTRVLTSEGIFPIEQLEGREDLVVTNLNNEASEASCFLSGHDKRLYKVKLQGGYTYYATAEHKWPVYERYVASHQQLTGKISKKTTVELQPNDVIPYTRSTALFEGIGGTNDEGFFVGWLLGDGWVTQSNGCEYIGVIVGDDDASVKERLLAFMRENGSAANFRPSTKGCSEELNTTNARISALLKRCGWRGKDNLPALVWTGTEEFRKGLIDGLMSSDGWFEPHGHRMCIGSSRETLIKDIQELLGFYGVPMTCEYRKQEVTFPNGNSGVYDFWEARAIGGYQTQEHFKNAFTLTNSRKQKSLDNAVANTSSKSFKPGLRVLGVDETELYEDVWDLSVRDRTHCFRLAGVVTGNCAEILLGDKSFCNLSTTALPKFNGDFNGLKRALYIMARANYRQTCVNLEDGILQRTWHELNEFLRLTGVNLTGFTMWEHQHDAKKLQELRDIAIGGANSMADELNLPRSKAVTTFQPSGTLGKIMDVTEGAHKPLGKYIFNMIRFSTNDPLVEILRRANYRVIEDPYGNDGYLVTFPVAYEGVELEEFTMPSGVVVEVNLEPAVTQLDRYKFLMDNYVDKFNVSITVSYSPEEVPAMIEWLHTNWDSYVGVSFLYRTDPTKTAEDLGFPYLPQTPVDKDTYDQYVSTLLPISLDGGNSHDEISVDGCVGGVCPVR